MLTIVAFVVALGLPAAGKPIVKIMRIRLMVEEHTYRRFHLNFLRIHRQAVMGNDWRAVHALFFPQLYLNLKLH